MNDDNEWKSGAPPAEGWYNASFERDPGLQRHWSGAHWSVGCYTDCPAEAKERARKTRGKTQAGIEWRALP